MSTLKQHQRTALFLAAAIILLLLAPGLGALATPDAETPLIRLQYATFDPLDGGPEVPAGGLQAGDPGGSRLQIVQFSGPVQEAWKADVEAAGARLYGYIPDYAFLARLEASSAAAVSALPFVRWIGPYHTAYRMPEALRSAAASGDAVPVELVVQALPDADLSALEAAVQGLGGSVKYEDINPFAAYLRVSLPGNQVEALAAQDEVVWVEPYLEVKLLNDVGGGGIMNANAVSAPLSLTGGGQIVGVADSGLDNGNLTTLHPDVRGRVHSAYCLGIPSPCDWSDFVSHGTHVVGSVLGNGSTSGGQYKGVAPQAQLVFQGVGDALGGLDGIPNDNGDLMRDAYDDGARIHTNSWGGATGGPANPYGGYVSSSQQVDQAMWEHKDMLVLFAAGNSGEDANANGLVDPDSIGQPGTAKNVLTVGASENNRPALNYLWGNAYGPPISTDKRANNPNGMAAFSSRGPTDDGRIKPDIVAPGTFIASLRTQQSAFKDNLEGSTALYVTLDQNGGTGSAWQLLTGDAHSATHYWKETISGSFNPNAITALFTPPFDARATGGVFDVHFWHKYSLNPGDQLVVILLDDVALTGVTYVLPLSGSTSSYGLHSETFSFGSFGYAPASVRVGFGIRSDGSSNSQWWLDDIRVDGADWGLMSTTGLAQPGDAVDENYLMMGGTSMATPLTAGATALTREWLVERRGYSNPSAALMKAVLINGAANMSPGQYTSPQEVPAQRPNNVTGWGRVDLLSSLNPSLPRQVWLQDTTTGLTTSGQASYTINVGNTAAAAASAPAASEAAAYSMPDNPLPQADGTPEPPGAAPRRVELALASANGWRDTASVMTSPEAPQASVSLVLDDGAHEDNLGLVDSGLGVSYQFIWLNRFTPAASEFPFNLEQIQVLFDGNGGISVGDEIDLVVYQDSDGNPANGASLLRVINETVKADDGVTWSVYNLASPVLVSGPGDVLIAVVNRYVVDGVSPISYPAAIDQSSNQNRSWAGWWLSIPPDPPVLPPDLTFDLIGNLGVTGGNWLVRGYGNTVSSPSPTPSTTPPPTTGGPLRITLAWTDYPGLTAAAKALVNDLDLEVIAPNGTHYYGNAGLYSSGQCFRASKWDACNNVEGVLIANAPYGNYTILVHGYNIPNGPQPFAVVASGDSLLGGTGNLNKKVYLPMQRK